MHEEIASKRLEIDFQAFFYNSPVPMGIVTTEMEFVAVNKQVLVQLQYTEEELLGKSVVDFVEVGQIGFDFENLRRLLAREISSYSLDRSFIKKDGTLIKGANTMYCFKINGLYFFYSFFIIY